MAARNPRCSSCAALMVMVLGLLAGGRGVAQVPSGQSRLALPYSNTIAAPNTFAFWVTNIAVGPKSIAIAGQGYIGVHGQANSDGGRGIVGVAKGPGSVGVSGNSDQAFGVYGVNEGMKSDGVRGVGLRGVTGHSWTPEGAGVFGMFKDGDTITVSAEHAKTTTTHYVAGVTRGWLGTPMNGVMGRSDVEDGKGVAGVAEGSENSVGVYGASTKGFAAFFKGKVTIQGHLLANTIHVEQINAGKGLIGGAAGKFFKMDHPLDPANKILYHASVESPELKNFYDGVVILDDNGAARIRLPDYFEALNKDFRYQLTCIGGYAPVYVAKEVQKGTFEIAGGRPGMKVSWQVTGVRHDAYATKHPMKVEEAKKPAERGRYLYPVEHGFPDSLGIDYRRDLVKGIEGTKPATVRSRRGTK